MTDDSFMSSLQLSFICTRSDQYLVSLLNEIDDSDLGRQIKYELESRPPLLDHLTIQLPPSYRSDYINAQADSILDEFNDEAGDRERLIANATRYYRYSTIAILIRYGISDANLWEGYLPPHLNRGSRYEIFVNGIIEAIRSGSIHDLHKLSRISIAEVPIDRLPLTCLTLRGPKFIREFISLFRGYLYSNLRSRLEMIYTLIRDDLSIPEKAQYIDKATRSDRSLSWNALWNIEAAIQQAHRHPGQYPITPYSMKDLTREISRLGYIIDYRGIRDFRIQDVECLDNPIFDFRTIGRFINAYQPLRAARASVDMNRTSDTSRQGLRFVYEFLEERRRLLNT